MAKNLKLRKITYQEFFIIVILFAVLAGIILFKLNDLGLSEGSLVLLWAYTLISVILVSLVSLIGILTLGFSVEKLGKLLLFLVSLSVGTLLGDALIHLLPETVEKIGFNLSISSYVLLGIVTFFVLDKFIQWRHCHLPPSENHIHSFALMNLIGDAFHNLLDGVLIAGSYVASIPLGIATTIAVIAHEMPQEIGDFGVLLQGGLNRRQAVIFNFITALTAVIGAVLALILSSFVESFTVFIVPFTAGAFIYIAGADLIPEMHKETNPKNSALQLLGIILGLAIMYLLTFLG